MKYFAYGHTIESDLPSEIWPEDHSDRVPDIIIQKKETLPHITWDPQTHLCERQSDGSLAIGFKEIGLIHILNDRLIHAMPCKNVDPRSLSLFLAGSAVSVALTLKGRYVFHGNAAKLGESCVIVTGASGAGKSTVANAFLNAKIPLLTDDVCVIDTRQNPPILYPSYPSLKLWKQTLEDLNIPYENSKKISDHLDKYYLPMNDLFWAEPLPISHIFLLEKNADISDVQVQPLSNTAFFEQLILNAHRFFYIKQLNMTKAQFTWASVLSQTVKGAKLIRPDSKMVADQIVSLIQEGVLHG